MSSRQASEGRAPERRADHPLRIFVVEDHQDTRELLCLMLEQLGHTVLAAASMHEALERLPDADCDVLISDIGLPDGDGWQLLSRLRLPRPIYAIAISGRGMNGDRARSFSAGYHHHLLKPSGAEELGSLLEQAARQMRSHSHAADALSL